MSTPDHDRREDEHVPGQPQPPYGQAPGQYGQAPGQYGQAPPPYGQPYAPQPYGSPPPGYGFPTAARTNGMAIASMVLGILWIYWIGSILALIFGYVARRQIKERGEAGSGMAVAGIVLGWIGIATLALVIFLGVAGYFNGEFLSDSGY